MKATKTTTKHLPRMVVTVSRPQPKRAILSGRESRALVTFLKQACTAGAKYPADIDSAYRKMRALHPDA